MIEGYKTKDMKAKKVKAEPKRAEGEIFEKEGMWCFHWGTTIESFSTEEYAKTALSNLSNI